MNEYQRIITGYIRSVLAGDILERGATINFLISAKRAAKSQEEKTLANDIFKKVDECLYIENSIANTNNKDGKKRRCNEIKAWLTQKLNEIEQ